MAKLRKLAAIMAVDLVGYSKLMGEDEVETALAVWEHGEAIRHRLPEHDRRCNGLLIRKALRRSNQQVGGSIAPRPGSSLTRSEA